MSNIAKCFVLYCKSADIKPCIYKRFTTIRKKLEKSPQMTYESFNSEAQANQFVQLIKSKIQKMKNEEIKDWQAHSQKMLSQLYATDGFKKDVMQGFKPIKMPTIKSEQIIAFFDGCSKGNPGKSGAGFWFHDGEGGRRCTNNQAEFRALLMCLATAYCNKIQRLKVYGDSQLIIKAMCYEYKISSFKIIRQYESALILTKFFDEVRFNFIPRNYNIIADKLANQSVF